MTATDRVACQNTLPASLQSPRLRDEVQAFYVTWAKGHVLLDVENLDGYETEDLAIYIKNASGPVKFDFCQTIAIETFDGSTYIGEITDLHDCWTDGGQPTFLQVDLV